MVHHTATQVYSLYSIFVPAGIWIYDLRSGATDGNCHNCKTSLVIIRKCKIILYKRSQVASWSGGIIQPLLSWELSKSWEPAAAVSLLKTLPLIEGKGFTAALKWVGASVRRRPASKSCYSPNLVKLPVFIRKATVLWVVVAFQWGFSWPKTDTSFFILPLPLQVFVAAKNQVFQIKLISSLVLGNGSGILSPTFSLFPPLLFIRNKKWM